MSGTRGVIALVIILGSAYGLYWLVTGKPLPSWLGAPKDSASGSSSSGGTKDSGLTPLAPNQQAGLNAVGGILQQAGLNQLTSGNIFGIGGSSSSSSQKPNPKTSGGKAN